MFPPLARPEVQALRMSKIREVANAGRGRDDILAFWFDESDQPTPDFIRVPAARAFGPEGEGWLRLCFAAKPEKNAAGLERLAGYLR